MRYRKLTSDGDYSFGGGELDFYRDVPEAVGLAVESRMLLWLGEWYQNVGEGTPFLQGILGKHSKNTADTVIQDRILGTQGVTNIQEYESEIDPTTRGLSASVTVNTIYGVTDLEVLNYAYY